MKVGFTGTRDGLTPAQHARLLAGLRALGVTLLHHGDCQGADLEAHNLARALGAAVELHPPEDNALRAFAPMLPGETSHPARPYLVRNAAIVAACEVLVACPNHEQPMGAQRGGTQWTVREARRVGRPVVIVRPSGRVEKEAGR